MPFSDLSFLYPFFYPCTPSIIILLHLSFTPFLYPYPVPLHLPHQPSPCHSPFLPSWISSRSMTQSGCYNDCLIRRSCSLGSHAERGGKVTREGSTSAVQTSIRGKKMTTDGCRDKCCSITNPLISLRMYFTNIGLCTWFFLHKTFTKKFCLEFCCKPNINVSIL